jgi:hypothetical protein
MSPGSNHRCCQSAFVHHYTERTSLLVRDNSVDFGTVVTLDTETDLLVGFKVITVVGNGSFVNESELVC